MRVYFTSRTQQPVRPRELHEKLLVSAPFFHVAGATAMMLSIWRGQDATYAPSSPVHPETLAAGCAAGKARRTPSSSPAMLKRDHGSGGLRQATTSPRCARSPTAPRRSGPVRGASAQGVRCEFSPRGIGLISAYRGQATESRQRRHVLGPKTTRPGLSTDTEVKERVWQPRSGKPMPRCRTSASWMMLRNKFSSLARNYRRLAECCVRAPTA